MRIIRSARGCTRLERIGRNDVKNELGNTKITVWRKERWYGRVRLACPDIMPRQAMRYKPLGERRCDGSAKTARNG